MKIWSRWIDDEFWVWEHKKKENTSNSSYATIWQKCAVWFMTWREFDGFIDFVKQWTRNGQGNFFKRWLQQVKRVVKTALNVERGFEYCTQNIITGNAQFSSKEYGYDICIMFDIWYFTFVVFFYLNKYFWPAGHSQESRVKRGSELISEAQKLNVEYDGQTSC